MWNSLGDSTVQRMQTRSHIVEEQRSMKGPFASGRLQKSGSCCQMWWKAPLDLQHRQTSLCTTMGWRNKATSLQNRSVLIRTIWCCSFWIICFSSTVICWVGCQLLTLHLCTPWIISLNVLLPVLFVVSRMPTGSFRARMYWLYATP